MQRGHTQKGNPLLCFQEVVQQKLESQSPQSGRTPLPTGAASSPHRSHLGAGPQPPLGALDSSHSSFAHTRGYTTPVRKDPLRPGGASSRRLCSVQGEVVEAAPLASRARWISKELLSLV